jgi:hypothetical protein
MKRLDSGTAKRSQKHLVLHRETLRRLDNGDLVHVVGAATALPNCTLTTTRQDDDDNVVG